MFCSCNAKGRNEWSNAKLFFSLLHCSNKTWMVTYFWVCLFFLTDAQKYVWKFLPSCQKAVAESTKEFQDIINSDHVATKCHELTTTSISNVLSCNASMYKKIDHYFIFRCSMQHKLFIEDRIPWGWGSPVLNFWR